MTFEEITNLLETPKLLTKDTIKAIVAEIAPKDATQEEREIIEESLSLYAKVGNYSAWLTEVDSHANTLLERITPEDSEAQTTWRVKLLRWYDVTGQLAGGLFNDVKQQLSYYQKGIKYAQDFLTNCETAAAVREQVLKLYVNAGGSQKEVTQKLSYYQKGIEYAQDFLANGETAAAVREQVLKLYFNAGFIQKKLLPKRH